MAKVPASTSPVRPPGAPRLFHRTFADFLRDLSRSSQRFWVLVVATGIAGGLGAVFLVHLLRGVQVLVWPGPDGFDTADAISTPLQRILIPLAGGVLVSCVALALRRPLGGHGTSGVIEAIWIKSGQLSLPRALVRGVVSIIAVGMGASLGREGALIQSGAATGSYLAERFQIATDQKRLLVAAGAASGIAAAYNMPIGASLFGLEVFLGSFALDLFGPVVVACVIAVFLSRVLIANHPTYEIAPYVLGSAPRQLVVALIVGILVGVASAFYVKVIDLGAGLATKIPRRVGFFLPPVAMAILGVVAIWFPQLFGNGYSVVNQELLGGLPLGLLVALPFLKLAMTTLCASSGVPGGLFTPSLFYGALLGGALGELAHRLVPGVGLPQAYALVGMCAALAGTTHATVSATVMIFELTGNYGVVLPLLLASVASAAISRRLVKESLYTAPLLRRNVRLPEMPRPDWLGATPARAILTPEPPRTLPSTPFAEIVARLVSLHTGNALYVCDAEGRYQGLILLDAIKAHIADQDLLEMVIAADVVDRRTLPVTADTPVAEVAARFGSTPMESLPVVDESGRLVGTISKSDVLRRGRF